MRVRIHRGSHEIGGNCIEVAADDSRRVVLDLGQPLAAEPGDEVPLPRVPGLTGGDPSLLGVVVSHPHPDHCGMLRHLHPAVPVFIGREAQALLEAASFFSPLSQPVEAHGHLRHREPFTLGPFTLTPFLNDHSAFDAYSLLVEVDGERLLYTGDLRGHGRKAALFEELLSHPPADVDALLMEGTHVRSDDAGDTVEFESESELEMRLAEACRQRPGAVVVFASAQNLDRVVTAFRAAKRSGRTFVTDLYGATVAAATRPTIPQPGFDGLAVCVPQRQRVAVKESGEFHRIAAIEEWRVFPEQLAADPGRFLLLVPASTAGELLRAGVLEPDGLAVWSMWSGYLERGSGPRLRAQLAEAGVRLVEMHTSGHASVPDLRRLVEAVDPGRVVPIHSEAAGRFAELFPRVDVRSDGEWWEVAGSASESRGAAPTHEEGKGGEELRAGRTVRELASWWVAAELMERHAEQLRLVEMHPGGGQYDCLTLCLRHSGEPAPPSVISINRNGGLHLSPIGTAELVRWPDPLGGARAPRRPPIARRRALRGGGPRPLREGLGGASGGGHGAVGVPTPLRGGRAWRGRGVAVPEWLPRQLERIGTTGRLVRGAPGDARGALTARP